MNTYTWTHTGRTGARTYQDPAREIWAWIDRHPAGGWTWQVDHFGRILAGGPADTLRAARVEAEAWIATATEVTPA